MTGTADKRTARTDWVDLCRFFAIFLVAWLHFGAPGKVDGFVHAFHIPVFYFLSGYCFHADRHPSFSVFLRKRARRLLCPYLVLSAVLYAFWSAVNALLMPENLVSFRHWARCVVFPASSDLNNLWGAVQWFLPSLFFTEVLYYFPARKIKNPAVLFAGTAGASLAAVQALRAADVRLPLALDTAFAALLFYGAGGFTRRSGLTKGSAPRRAGAFLLSAGVCLGAYLLNGPVNLRAMTTGDPLLFAAGGLGGCLMTALAARAADDRLKSPAVRERLLSLGQKTIVLLYLHRLFDGLHKTALALFGIPLPPGAAGRLYMFIVTIVFFVISIPLLRLGDRRKGQRRGV